MRPSSRTCSGTNSAIDGTPMQGLTNGATAVGFNVGYVALNFTIDCTTGYFAASSTASYGRFTQGKSLDTQLGTPAVNASQSCYAFAGMLSITPNINFVNDYALRGFSQPGVTFYMGKQFLVGHDLFLNYPTGLPDGVRCDIQVKATEHDTLSYVRYYSTSPAFVSSNTTTSASCNGTGTLNLGFNKVKLLAAYDPTDVGADLTCGFKQAGDTFHSVTLQPYCSLLLSYSTPTTTSTQVISTTTTSTITVNYGRRRRSIITAAPMAAEEPLRRREPNASVAASTMTPSAVNGEPSVLARFSSQDVTNACSFEATPVTTTITEVTSTTTTLTAYATATNLPNPFLLSTMPFFVDNSGTLRSWQNSSLTLVDHYEPNSGTVDNAFFWILRVIQQQTSTDFDTMCFGGRTTFVCQMSMCQNKHWETRWYTFGADADKCVMSEPVGPCSDPWMVYHEEEKHCTACLIRFNTDSPPPPLVPGTFHPEDHARAQPHLMDYEQREAFTVKTTGELTGPMIVARESDRQLPDSDM
ncbi:unnamed protein product [Aureobasidium vineae]|uniref:Uncharacterized protein n=1 Tax=Aureobasidium vineae TaxID=2773715 RepID=A0A9N8JZB2_9PEZI|nr:unnamed protein product [Aureobasidium vineae]